MTEAPTLAEQLATLLASHGITRREAQRITGVPRAAIARLMQHRLADLIYLETLFGLFGYSLTAVQTKGPDPCLLKPLPSADAAKPLPMEPAAPAAPKTMPPARQGTIKIVRLPANGAIPASSNPHGKVS